MSDCPFNSRLDAYYDGELSASEMEQIAAHLQQCDSCRHEVAQLRELSQVMGQFQAAPISQIELARLHRSVEDIEPRSLVRFGTVLATMAASVLIISVTWIAQFSGGSSGPTSARIPGNVPEWERLALGEPPRAPEMNNNLGLPDTGVAFNQEMENWMLNQTH